MATENHVSSTLRNITKEAEDGEYPTLKKYSALVKKKHLFSQPREVLLHISSI